jgi:uncharacterized protein (DUF58 family)
LKTSWLLYPSQLKNKTKTNNTGVIISLGYPVLFHWLALAVTLGLLVFAAVRHIIPLLAITGLFLVLAIVSWFWSWRSLRELSLQLTLSQSRLFPGENTELVFELTNGKWLFLSWLEIEAELPWRLAAGRVKTPSPYAKKRLRWTTSISGRQRISWKHNLECKARGEYQLGPLRLRSGDIFGLFPREMILPHFEPLLVYPQIVPVDDLGLPLRELVGERIASRNIYEDVSRTTGSRDYRHDDAFNRIHWKATARHVQLQTRQYESTTSLSLLLVLDIYDFCQQGQENEDLFELSVTTAASLAYKAHLENLPVGLIANSAREIQIPTGSGRGQLLLILEALARIQAVSQVPLKEQLDKYKSSLPMGTTMVIITGVLSPSTNGLVRKLEHEGRCLFLVKVGDEKMPVGDLGDIPVLSVQNFSDLSRGYGEARS